MAKFKFRLSTLHNLRETHRDEMREKLAEAYQAEQLLEQQQEAIHQEEKQLQQLHRSTVKAGTADVNQLLDVQRYGAALKGQLATLQSQRDLLVKEVEKRRQALVEADQQVKLLEKLHERQLESHRRESLRHEAKELDEIGSRLGGIEQ